MIGFLVLLLAIAPWIVSALLTYHYSQSFLALLWVIIGAIAGALFIPLSGVYWLQTLHRSTMESQGVGMIFVPVILPFFAYSGSVAGVSVVAGFYLTHSSGLSAIAISFLSLILVGLLPSAIAKIPSTSEPSAPSRSSNQVLWLPIGAIANGIIGAALAIYLTKAVMWVILQIASF
jgi:uncharacterized membrane protein